MHYTHYARLRGQKNFVNNISFNNMRIPFGTFKFYKQHDSLVFMSRNV